MYIARCGCTGGDASFKEGKLRPLLVAYPPKLATTPKITEKVSVPVIGWQKTAALGAVFGTLSTRAQPARLAALTIF